MPKGVPRNGLYRGQEPRAAWVEREQARAPLCACGCGDRIVIQPHHRSYGIPHVLVGHHARVRGHARECHPNWHSDRRAVSGGRSGAYFTPAIRRTVLERAQGHCEDCGIEAVLEVDHIVPVAAGGNGELENAQALCHACHTAKTAAERRQRRAS